MAKNLAAAALRYGKLWGRGHETFPQSTRRILSIKGKGDNPTKYLQGLVTCDLLSEPTAPRIQTEKEIERNLMESGDGDVDGNDEMEIPPINFTSKMRSTCFLDQKGRILTDALLWKKPFENGKGTESESDNVGSVDKDEEIEYLVDVPGDSADLLLNHLKKYKPSRNHLNPSDAIRKHSGPIRNNRQPETGTQCHWH